jgi:hypothetical protein
MYERDHGSCRLEWHRFNIDKQRGKTRYRKPLTTRLEDPCYVGRIARNRNLTWPGRCWPPVCRIHERSTILGHLYLRELPNYRPEQHPFYKQVALKDHGLQTQDPGAELRRRARSLMRRRRRGLGSNPCRANCHLSDRELAVGLASCQDDVRRHHPRDGWVSGRTDSSDVIMSRNVARDGYRTRATKSLALSPAMPNATASTRPAPTIVPARALIIEAVAVPYRRYAS